MAGIAALFFCLLMVLFPDLTMYSARKGISLWVQDVLPALFPFFICANFLMGIGAVRYLRSGSFPFIMSVLSGYPVGAKIIGDLKRENEISQKEAKRLMSFCSTSGPAFLMGTVGVGMLGAQAAGMIIASAHYSGAVINGILYTKWLGKEPGKTVPAVIPVEKGIQDVLTDAILASFRSLGIILAYIVLFMLITDMIHMSGVLMPLGSSGAEAVVKGFFEMTVGCGAVASCADMTLSMKTVLCAAIMSWGGLSVMGQTMSMLSGTGISTGYLLIVKLTHSLFSAVIAFVMSLIVL